MYKYPELTITSYKYVYKT